MSIFNDVFIKKPGRSLFNLSHEKKFTANFGYLYPFLIVDAVPGDTFKLACEMFVRTSPLIAPVMHRVNVKVNYFFVPNRLIWDEWQDFITGVNQSSSPDSASIDNPYFYDEANPVKPYMNISTIVNADKEEVFRDGSLADFLGFPTLRPGAHVAQGTDFKIDLMPFYAYNKVYVDWYRNQNVEGGYEGAHQSGEHDAGTIGLMYLQKRAYEKDYFTSALPFAQRGDAVQIPISTEASITFNRNGATRLKKTDGTNQTTESVLYNNTSGRLASTTQLLNVDNSSNLQISGNVAGTINDLRIATRIQRWLEKNARVGGRYIEQILSHFGVHSSDARLQRAEYLGGYTCPIVISDVEQTSNTAGTAVSGTDTPQGNLSGKGTAYGSSKPIKCFCEEHGFIIGLMSILPRTSYQDGLPRMYTRSTRYDYYFPEFANLGEQDVKRSELFFDLSDTTKQSTERFGYQERYCEYKYIPSTVHGEFKNNLSFWHLGRQFSDQPTLNRTFVQCKDDASINRIFAVTDSTVSDHFYVDLFNDVRALRPMPKQAIPTL